MHSLAVSNTLTHIRHVRYVWTENRGVHGCSSCRCCSRFLMLRCCGLTWTSAHRQQSIQHISPFWLRLIPPLPTLGAVLTPPLSSTLFVPRSPSSTTIPRNSSPAPHGTSWGSNYQPKSVRLIEPARRPQSLTDALLSFPAWRMQRSRHCRLSFRISLGLAGTPRVESYDKFQREADEYDSDFMKKYDEDLNTTLIFVSLLSFSHIYLDRDSDSAFLGEQSGLFSAITSVFTADAQNNIQPDYNELPAPHNYGQCLTA